VIRTDLVVLWDTPVDDTAREVYSTSRALVVEVPDPGLPAFVQRVLAALSE